MTADDPGADVKMSDWNDDHEIIQGRSLWWQPIPASTTTAGGIIGGGISVLGTFTARTPATTGMFASMHRGGMVAATTANSRSGAYFAGNTYWRGNAAGLGGFYAVFRFGTSDAATVATANMFVGLTASSGIGSGGAEPSATTNVVGVGADSTELNLSIMHNDGSGTCTKVALGANFPAHTLSTDAYELMLYCAPNASEIEYCVTRLNTGDTASGTLTTNLPVSTQMMFPMFMRGNMSTTLAVGIDAMGLLVETEV